ncbi:MAG: class I adenylate-forming enzyme family protein [Armatimonadota bacterium]|nr:class I adenylate-forming enzyme family protein [Armatimonadota bacterium]
MFRNPFVQSFQVPVVPVFQLVERWARIQPERPALIWGPTGREVTYRDLWRTSGRVARALQELGIKKGERVVLLSPNCPHYPSAFYGVLRAGGIVVPLNPLLKATEVIRAIENTQAAAVVASPQRRAQLRELVAGLPFVRHVLEMEEVSNLTPPSLEPEPVCIDPDRDLACILYSSGTTGWPKGIMLTHRNVVADLLASNAMGFITDQSVYVHYLPFSHCAGLLTFLNAGICLGARQILTPHFDPGEVLRLVEDHQARELFGVPPALKDLVEAAEAQGFHYRGLRFVNTAALPLDVELSRRAERVFGCPVTEHIGMTECAGPMNIMIPPFPLKPRSVGPPIPNLEERVVDPETGEDLGPGQVGELLLRGDMVTAGYWQDTETNQEAFREGWFRTGDLVRFDHEGYMWWVDRCKEIIKYKGYSIPPAELEEVLREHPAVREACVIPKEHPEFGQVPKAFVVRRAPVTAEELMRFVEERIAPYKKVREVEFVEELPKSAVGKILRRVLVEREKGREHARERFRSALGS